MGAQTKPTGEEWTALRTLLLLVENYLATAIQIERLLTRSGRFSFANETCPDNLVEFGEQIRTLVIWRDRLRSEDQDWTEVFDALR